MKNTRPTVAAWDRQKRIFANPRDHSYVELGFATFFLNRTNRSGILNGGIIDGRDQTGPWKIDARYNASELVFRIESIAKMCRRIKLTRSDALALLQHGLPKWPVKTLIYLAPYFERGRELYYDYYKDADHEALARFIGANMRDHSWIVSYDNVAPIKKLYAPFRSVVYNVGYTARTTRIGKEIMFFAPELNIPRLVGPIRQVGKIKKAA